MCYVFRRWREGRGWNASGLGTDQLWFSKEHMGIV